MKGLEPPTLMVPIPTSIQRGVCPADESENLFILLWGKEETGREVQEAAESPLWQGLEAGLELHITGDGSGRLQGALLGEWCSGGPKLPRETWS